MSLNDARELGCGRVSELGKLGRRRHEEADKLGTQFVERRQGRERLDAVLAEFKYMRINIWAWPGTTLTSEPILLIDFKPIAKAARENGAEILAPDKTVCEPPNDCRNCPKQNSCRNYEEPEDEEEDGEESEEEESEENDDSEGEAESEEDNASSNKRKIQYTPITTPTNT